MPGLHLLGATGDMVGAEVEMTSMEGKEFLLRRALNGLKAGYEFVIIDCPPSLGMLTINSLNTSNYLIIPALCEYFTLDGLSQLGNTYSIIKESSNADLIVMGVIITMYIDNDDYHKEVYNL